MILEGIIQKEGKVLGEDNCVYSMPIRGVDDEGFQEVLMNAKSVGDRGSFARQSIKPYIGMIVEFCYNVKPYGFNYTIMKNKEVEK